MSSNGKIEENKVPLLDYAASNIHKSYILEQNQNEQSFSKRFWIETKKLWHIVGPAIFSRIVSYSMFVITQAFAGHLGDLELAAMSIASNVVLGFDFGLMLGMASALETLCGQAFGAKKYYMLGVYLQRSWIVLFLCCIIMMPLFLFATPVLKFLGQPEDIAELSGLVVLAFIPLHFSFAFQFHLGIIGTTLTLNISWWLVMLMLFGYTVFGGCPLSWTGFSMEAFSGLWDFFKLSVSSGIMLCLENWYYRVLIVMTGNLQNAKIAVDALSICMNINGWELMIPLGFFAGTGVRVANELGAGNGKGAKFATAVAVTQSIVIGLFFWILIIFFHNELALIFSTSQPVLEAVHKLSILLAFTVLLNSVQPILSGVAVGSGWQAYVAYINLGCYYLLGVPLGFIMGWGFHYGVMGIWAGMIFGGTAVQTLILAIITIRCDWNKEAEKASTHVKKWEDVGHLTS
nr:protein DETOXIFICATION 27-like isoform X2 [Nicotiana tomentosiformis]